MVMVLSTHAIGGAATALDNLASVAINTSLISDTDSTDDLGSTSKYWANTYTDQLYTNGYTGIGTTTPPTGTIFSVSTPSTAGPGTVAVNASSATVTGTDTLFIHTFVSGDTITANGETHTVISVASATSLTTSDTWTSTASNQTYTIVVRDNVMVTLSGALILGGEPIMTNGAPKMLQIIRTFSEIGGAPYNVNPMIVRPIVSNTIAAFGNALYGFNSGPQIGAANTQNVGSLVGFLGGATVNSGASGTITNLTGAQYNVNNGSSGATVTNAASLQVNAPANSGTMTSAVGVSVGNVTAAANNSQLILGSTAIPAGNFGIYNSSAYDNYFAGNIGIGTTAPTTLLYIKAADSSTAQTILINAAQANVTAADTFIDFRSTTGSEGSITGTAAAGVIAYNTFTGSHYTQIIDKTDLKPLMLLEAAGEKIIGFNGTTRDRKISIINEELRNEDNKVIIEAGTFDKIITEVFHASSKEQIVKSRICRTKKSPSAWGFYGGTDKEGRDFVLSLGTGFAVVTNTGVNIKIGDYLMSSDEAGQVEIQDDDLLHNYTVAKTLEQIIWNVNELKRKIAVSYHCG